MTGLCVAGDRCRGFDRRTGLPAEAVDGPLCEGELLASERAVSALVLDYRDLEQHLPPSLGVWGDGQPAATGELQVPMRLDVEACQRQIWWTLTAWEDVIRDRERLSDAPRHGVRDGAAVQRAAGILAPRVRLLAGVGPTWMWSYPPVEGPSEVTGAQGVLDLAELHQRAQRMLGLTRPLPERCDGVACRECDMRALYREPGEDTVRCGACDRQFTAEEYRRWTGLLAEYAKSKDVA